MKVLLSGFHLNGLQWATNVLRHFAILEYFKRPISPSTPRFYSLPLPQTMLDFMSQELAFFLNNIEKGEGVGLNVNRISNRISEILQLGLDSSNCRSQLLLSFIVGFDSQT